MFHVNESKNGRGTLLVSNGKMTLHVSLASKSILNLYLGKADAAKLDEKNWIDHTIDQVTYVDSFTEAVHGFTIPVKRINQDFDLALIGKKGVWYDHKVSVSDIQQRELLQDGVHQVWLTLEGGSGKVKLISPSSVKVEKGRAFLTLIWSSSNIDYMLVDGKKYLNQTPGKNSTFTFPVKDLNKVLSVIADTTAMGNPHEIEYKIGIMY